MASVSVQKKTAPAAAPIATTREPFKAMRELLGWDPFSEMAPTWPALEGHSFVPSFEVKETEKAFVFKADMPGIEEKDIDVRLTNNRLTVSGKRESEKSEQNETYYTTERSYGSFTRAFTLPEGIEGEEVAAELTRGVLTVTVPKKPETQPKKVNVTSK